MFKTIHWHDDAVAYAESYGLTKKDCEAILLSKSRPQIDKRSHEVGHLIVRYRAGDVVVVVGHRDKEEPVIMSVWVDTHEQRDNRSSSMGSTGVSAPKSMREFTKRVMALGYRVEHGGAHLRITAKDGTYISSSASTPSDKYSIPNAWRTFNRQRIKYEHDRNKETK